MLLRLSCLSNEKIPLTNSLRATFLRLSEISPMAKVANEPIEPFAADNVSDIDSNLEPTSEGTKIN